MGKPRIVIVAGPNGAGKTTFARQYVVISSLKRWTRSAGLRTAGRRAVRCSRRSSGAWTGG